MSDWSPLLSAVLAGDAARVSELLAAGAAIDTRDRSSDTPLHHAATNGLTDMVALLIQAGADVNAVNWDDETPLLAVTADGEARHDVIRQLLAAGANVDTADSSGVTPLMWAVTNKDPVAVVLLLEAGADLSCRDAEGDDIWDYARDEIVYSEEVYLALLAAKGSERANS